MDNYIIKNYTVDSFSVEISEFTNTPLSYVLEKSFIGYLDAYLTPWKNTNGNIKTGFGISILSEKNYIDTSYLDDFAHHYAKNFQNYEKNCLRAHFFQCSPDDVSIIYEYNTSKEKIEELKKHYLGFIVIRPIPEYFIARACISVWPGEDKKHLFITNNINASLCGIDFSVQSIPFMEQDHVVSVCATSALWTFLYTNKTKNNLRIQSPYEITNGALLKNNTFKGDNLTPGYTIDMICQCIKDNNLSPILFDATKLKIQDVKEICHIFIKSDYPVILGLQVYNKDKKEIGLHAVTVLGDNEEDSKLYIHDDRLGFYVSLKVDEKDYWGLFYPKSASKKIKKADDEYYKITDIVTGIYPKIRLPLATIRLLCKYLISDLREYSNIKSLDYLKFSISIVESNKLKKIVRKSYTVYNNADCFLEKSLPKNLWIAEFLYEGKNCFTLVFDSTEVPQGDILLYILEYKNTFPNLLQKLYETYRKNIINGVPLCDVFNEDMISFYNYFKKIDNKKINIYEKLTELYGFAKSPRYINPEEFTADELKDQNAYKITSKEDANKFKFDSNIDYYIWIIDEEGFLYIGTEDKEDLNSVNKGHPTLIQGRKGRIGGEIHHKNLTEDQKDIIVWTINSKSGRYSWEDDSNSKDNISHYLRNALNEKFRLYFSELRFDIEDGF